MKLKELNTLEGAELKTALKKNKESLIAEKKASVKFTDNVASSVTVVAVETELKKSLLKAEGSDSSDAPFMVTVVCNTANFCDSYMDVLTEDSYTKSITARGTSIPHIADHNHESTAHIGDVKAVYTKKVRCKDLGFSSEGETTALLMDTLVRKDYNEKVYEFYKAQKINQHSIGLRYENIQLALNSQVEDDAEEYAVWQKYYPSILNKELVDKKGYFWAVTEADILENSCVLFGANALTPTLTTEVKTFLPNNQQTIPTKGVNMKTVEELQAEVIKLQGELSTEKASKDLAIKAAVQEERTRIIGIQKAAETFGIKSSIEKFIEKGVSVESATDTFEMIKEQVQLANPSPEGKDVGTLNEKNTKNQEEAKPEAFGGILQGFESLNKSQEIFSTIR